MFMKSYILTALLVLMFGFGLVNAETPSATIIRSAPADGSVYPVNPLRRHGGVRTVTLYMNTLQGVRNASDFLVKTSAGEIIPIQRIQPISFPGVNMVVLLFENDRALPHGERTRITHLPSQSSVCLGVLAGDVDGNGLMTSADASKILGVIEGRLDRTALGLIADLNGDFTETMADYETFNDIFTGRNGQANPPLRRLPACPAI